MQYQNPSGLWFSIVFDSWIINEFEKHLSASQDN